MKLRLSNKVVSWHQISPCYDPTCLSCALWFQPNQSVLPLRNLPKGLLFKMLLQFEQLPATASNIKYLSWKNYVCLHLLQNIFKIFFLKRNQNAIILITEAAKVLTISQAFQPEILLATYHMSNPANPSKHRLNTSSYTKSSLMPQPGLILFLKPQFHYLLRHFPLPSTQLGKCLISISEKIHLGHNLWLGHFVCPISYINKLIFHLSLKKRMARI